MSVYGLPVVGRDDDERVVIRPPVRRFVRPVALGGACAHAARNGDPPPFVRAPRAHAHAHTSLHAPHLIYRTPSPAVRLQEILPLD